MNEGNRNVTEQMKKAICREFNVNYEYLAEGKGNMFSELPQNTLNELCRQYDLSHSAYVIIEKFVNLKPDAQEPIFNYVREVATAFQCEDVTLTIPTSTPTLLNTSNAPNASRLNLEELSDEEFGKLIRQQLNLEKEAKEKSEVS